MSSVPRVRPVRVDRVFACMQKVKTLSPRKPIGESGVAAFTRKPIWVRSFWMQKGTQTGGVICPRASSLFRVLPQAVDCPRASSLFRVLPQAVEDGTIRCRPERRAGKHLAANECVQRACLLREVWDRVDVGQAPLIVVCTVLDGKLLTCLTVIRIIW